MWGRDLICFLIKLFRQHHRVTSKADVVPFLQFVCCLLIPSATTTSLRVTDDVAFSHPYSTRAPGDSLQEVRLSQPLNVGEVLVLCEEGVDCGAPTNDTIATTDQLIFFGVTAAAAEESKKEMWYSVQSFRSKSPLTFGAVYYCSNEEEDGHALT